MCEGIPIHSPHHLWDVNDYVEVRTERADKWLDTPRPTVDPAVQSQLNRDISLDRLGEYLRTMYDIIVLAFQTDMTRVATFSTGNEGTGPSVPEIQFGDFSQASLRKRINTGRETGGGYNEVIHEI